MNRSRRAFTLIELLVTLAVIAVVLALLLGPLARAQDAGRQVRCLANLRDLHTATEMCRAENRDLFPYADSIAELFPAPVHAPFDALAPYLSIELPGDLEHPRPGPAPLWCRSDRIEFNDSGISYVYMPWDLMAGWPGPNPQRSVSIALEAAPQELLFIENRRRHNAGSCGSVDVAGAARMRSDR